jgi:hypothetical protein
MMTKTRCACGICGRKTLYRTGKVNVGWDGSDHRSHVKCKHDKCNFIGTLPTDMV